jgi:hypothetical protein
MNERPAVPDGWRIRADRDPVRLLFSASPWRAAGYLVSYLIVSGILLAVAVSTSALALVLGITVLALPVLISAAWLIRGCASVERLMLRLVVSEPVRTQYPPHQPGGLWRQARARWRDSGTWRDLACLVGLWPVLFALDSVVFAVWAASLGGVALPLWYSHVNGFCVGYCAARQNVQTAPGVMIGNFSRGPHGLGSHGLYIDSLHTAVLAAAGFAVLFLLFNYVLVAAARLHGQVARAMLRHPADPLAPALQVLTRPGPLGPLVGAERPGQPPD